MLWGLSRFILLNRFFFLSLDHGISMTSTLAAMEKKVLVRNRQLWLRRLHVTDGGLFGDNAALLAEITRLSYGMLANRYCF
jgi:hypothetical protein